MQTARSSKKVLFLWEYFTGLFVFLKNQRFLFFVKVEIAFLLKFAEVLVLNNNNNGWELFVIDDFTTTVLPELTQANNWS